MLFSDLVVKPDCHFFQLSPVAFIVCIHRGGICLQSQTGLMASMFSLFSPSNCCWFSVPFAFVACVRVACSLAASLGCQPATITCGLQRFGYHLCRIWRSLLRALFDGALAWLGLARKQQASSIKEKLCHWSQGKRKYQLNSPQVLGCHTANRFASLHSLAVLYTYKRAQRVCVCVPLSYVIFFFFF